MSSEAKTLFGEISDGACQALEAASPRFASQAGPPDSSVQTPGTPGAHMAPAGHRTPAGYGGAAGVPVYGAPSWWERIRPFARQLVPYVTQTVFAQLAGRYGDDIAELLRKFGPEAANLIGADRWARVESLLKLFVPESLGPELGDDIRPVFGAAFEPKAAESAPAAKAPEKPKTFK